MAPSDGDKRSPMAVGMELYSQIFSIAVMMALPAGVGYWVDSRLGSSPWLLIAGAAFGLVGGMVQLLRGLVRRRRRTTRTTTRIKQNTEVLHVISNRLTGAPLQMADSGHRRIVAARGFASAAFFRNRRHRGGFRLGDQLSARGLPDVLVCIPSHAAADAGVRGVAGNGSTRRVRIGCGGHHAVFFGTSSRKLFDLVGIVLSRLAGARNSSDGEAGDGRQVPRLNRMKECAGLIL